MRKLNAPAPDACRDRPHPPVRDANDPYPCRSFNYHSDSETRPTVDGDARQHKTRSLIGLPHLGPETVPRHGRRGGRHQLHPLRPTNAGPRTCSMIGYPGVAILNARGRVVQHAAARSTHPGTLPPEPVRLVVLKASQRAEFVVASTDVTPSPGCRTPHTGTTLEIYPPNQRTPILEPYHRSFCDLVVGPVQPAS
jgi:hypothetical protein